MEADVHVCVCDVSGWYKVGENMELCFRKHSKKKTTYSFKVYSHLPISLRVILHLYLDKQRTGSLKTTKKLMPPNVNLGSD